MQPKNYFLYLRAQQYVQVSVNTTQVYFLHITTSVPLSCFHPSSDGLSKSAADPGGTAQLVWVQA